MTSTELAKMTKTQLCALYRQMGGLGGMYPPEKWRKDEIISSILYAQNAQAREPVTIESPISGKTWTLPAGTEI